mgnify:CR=1 FL=1
MVTFAGETLEALDLVTMTAGSSDRVCGMRVTHRVCVIVWSLGEMFCLHNFVLVMFEELIMKLEKSDINILNQLQITEYIGISYEQSSSLRYDVGFRQHQ